MLVNIHADVELDLLIIKNGKRYGFEFKYTDFPKTSKSMHIAIQDLKLDSLELLYAGDKTFPLAEKITAYGLDSLSSGEFQKRFNIPTK